METTGEKLLARVSGVHVVLIATACVLLVPLVAMQFTDEVVWTASDFFAAAILLLGSGFTYVFMARKLGTKRQRIVLGAVVALALLYLWAELAVGIFFDLGS
ncbi:MAG TPA: hypothetical protein VFF16_10645 [Telluria sp.]|nr:hypothetical protein [Telluria sp.]